MRGIVGKIVDVKKHDRRDAGLTSVDVSFTPVKLLPWHTDLPEWLKDQRLTVTRRVADLREVGRPGDSIVLDVEESAAFLAPLRVDPTICRGRVPESLNVELLWQRDGSPGEVSVRAGGHTVTGKLRKRGARHVATVQTGGLFGTEPRLPVRLAVTCGALSAECWAVPADRPSRIELHDAGGVTQHVESPWYAVDLTPQRGGGIASLTEPARGADHFRPSPNMIAGILEHGGHMDCGMFGFDNKIAYVYMHSAGARTGSAAVHVDMEEKLDEGSNSRTAVSYAVYNDLPLVLLSRRVLFGEAKDGASGEPADRLVGLTMGFRTAFAVGPRSRVLSADAGSLAVLRPMTVNRWRRGWPLGAGWLLFEHPDRSECTLYMFDAEPAPTFTPVRTVRSLAVECLWPPLPIGPGGGAACNAALSAGELCGADASGAWVATRRPVSGGVEVAVVGRFAEPPAGPAAVTVGRRSAELPLERLLLPCVGEVHAGRTTIAGASMKTKLEITAGCIPARR